MFIAAKISNNFLSSKDFRVNMRIWSQLLTLKGVGPKVADCILLFGLGKRDVFPVDTWIEKVYLQDFNGTPTNRKNITKFFFFIFKDLSGYAQQYVFYYKRKDVHLIKEK